MWLLQGSFRKSIVTPTKHTSDQQKIKSFDTHCYLCPCTGFTHSHLYRFLFSFFVSISFHSIHSVVRPRTNAYWIEIVVKQYQFTRFFGPFFFFFLLYFFYSFIAELYTHWIIKKKCGSKIQSKKKRKDF